MKDILRYSVMAFMAAIALNISAQTVVTFDASEDKGSRASGDPGKDMVTKDGVTIATSNGCMDLIDQYRCYADADFTVTSTSNKIVKVEITCTANGEEKYGPGCFSSPFEGYYVYEEDSNVGTWTGNSTSISMSAWKQVRITQVVVTIGDTPVEPVFSVPEGIYFEPQDISFEEEPGYSVIYTLNGDDPTYTDDTHYTGTIWNGSPLNISETTTVKAIATNNTGNVSDIVTMTYTILNLTKEVTFDATEDKGSRTSSDPGEDQITKDGVTIAISNGCMDLIDQYRCYSDADFTVTSDTYKIVKVEITCTADGEEKYGPGCFYIPTEGTYDYKEDSNVGIWLGNADSFSMYALKQVRINKIVVYIGDTPVEPTGIKAITDKKLENDIIYNLQGVRVYNVRKGLYIINGKKVLLD